MTARCSPTEAPRPFPDIVVDARMCIRDPSRFVFEDADAGKSKAGATG
ncbi:hypothetical protein OHAE_4203 [Ochrobactrum soli]|uniref:Uncharacterized protein n=1 Tax=Ochrobactrum soli TaxID=2448455 RepID=A0A2P9HBD5_9HYPH|nr:hypothetical protein OHAE_4203 [[Ochrobactrum] soli]